MALLPVMQIDKGRRPHYRPGLCQVGMFVHVNGNKPPPISVVSSKAFEMGTEYSARSAPSTPELHYYAPTLRIEDVLKFAGP